MALRSAFPDVPIPSVPLPDYVLRYATSVDPKKAAFVDAVTAEVFSYGDVLRLVRGTAAGLWDLGLRPGDVIMILAPNSIEWPIAYLGIASMGATVTTCNPVYTPREVAHQALDSNTVAVITIPQLVPVVQAAGLGHRPIIVFGTDPPPTGTISFRTSVAGTECPPGAAPAVLLNPEDIVVLPYSSGTTGVAKGVMLSHTNLVANLAQINHEGPLGSVITIDEDSVLLGLLPFFHIYGMTCIMLAILVRGCSLVIMPKFDMKDFLEVIQRYRITFAHLVPPIILGLAKHPAVLNYDLSSLRSVMSGAAPLGKELIDMMQARLPTVAINQGYGLTESSPVVLITPDVRQNPSKAGSAGRLLPNTELKLIDTDTGAVAATGQQGEILVRGPQVMKGYLNNPAATKATIDAEGWLHTGDVAYADEDGNFFIVDRVKELIKVKGFQVPPAELESILLAHPDINDAAVIGQPDLEFGEVPIAFLVPGPDRTINEDQVKGFVASQVAFYKKIQHIRLIDVIPKSASGKILRKDLRALLASKPSSL